MVNEAWEGDVLATAEKVLNLSKSDQTEVHCVRGRSFLTRFANSEIHQNTAERDMTITVRCVIRKRVGVASTNRTDEVSLEEVISRAIAFAERQPENHSFVSLPGPGQYREAATFFRETDEFTPEDRADAVNVIIKKARKAGLVASGSFSTASYEVATVNSLGVRASGKTSLASLVTVIMGDGGSGYADRLSRNVADIDVEAAGDEAVNRCLLSRGAKAIEPGEYDVILDTYAVADMIGMLSYMGFGALAFQEGRSFMTGNLGKQITGENITIWDDGLSEPGLATRFDYEGVPKSRVDLITGGVARGVVYDSYTAGIEGRESTGHAVSPSFAVGPYATNLFMESGTSSLGEMIDSMGRGIFVTRFHYTNPVHPVKTIFTGMTRDGTFLIENGKIARPLKNLRFTQGILEALSRVELISRERRLHDMMGGGAYVPRIKVKGFNFTGVTEY
ncbi:MAG TPA: TldD/PmbA family protein [Firmicutes bacterium]|nr:TldD/PmbA family protein [Bacillota bacterium]